LPSPQYLLGQDRELTSVRFSNIIVGVLDVVITIYVEFQEVMIVLLQILVELGILLSELGQFHHMRGALIYVVQILSKVEEIFISRGRTVEFIYGCEPHHPHPLYLDPHHLVLHPMAYITLEFSQQCPAGTHVLIFFHETCPQEVIH
jgi:hypothetical protein